MLLCILRLRLQQTRGDVARVINVVCLVLSFLGQHLGLHGIW
eukprot:XP_001708011.1 Hypothetical protein GL50803_35384 [Giardia lamblia ATCC 50803]